MNAWTNSKGEEREEENLSLSFLYLKVRHHRHHCHMFLLFGPGGLRAPPVVADEAKLVIVSTYFFLHRQRSVAEPGPTPSTWSISVTVIQIQLPT